MTTVGYGDISPITPLGKVVAIFIALFGALLTALFVVTVEWMLEFENSENKAYKMLESLLKKDELRNAAATALLRVFRMGRAKTKSKKLKFRKKLREDFLKLRK